MRLRFGPFTLDLATRQLRSGNREIHVSPKAFELLAKLALDRPRVLSKSDLQQHLWPDTFVAEANLSNLIAKICEALGDRARAPIFIRTAHGFGYSVLWHRHIGWPTVTPSGSGRCSSGSTRGFREPRRKPQRIGDSQPDHRP